MVKKGNDSNCNIKEIQSISKTFKNKVRYS